MELPIKQTELYALRAIYGGYRKIMRDQGTSEESDFRNSIYTYLDTEKARRFTRTPWSSEIRPPLPLTSRQWRSIRDAVAYTRAAMIRQGLSEDVIVQYDGYLRLLDVLALPAYVEEALDIPLETDLETRCRQ